VRATEKNLCSGTEPHKEKRGDRQKKELGGKRERSPREPWKLEDRNENQVCRDREVPIPFWHGHAASQISDQKKIKEEKEKNRRVKWEKEEKGAKPKCLTS